jgi:hypothetical protein
VKLFDKLHKTLNQTLPKSKKPTAGKVRLICW